MCSTSVRGEDELAMKSRYPDHPGSYAADCLAAAQVNISRLLASGVLFVALLTAMTFVEAPMASDDVRAHIAGVPMSTSSTVAAGRADYVLGCLRQDQDDHERS